VVKTGEVVKVKVLEVDLARKRISLTMKLDARPCRPRRATAAGADGAGDNRFRPGTGRGQRSARAAPASRRGPGSAMAAAFAKLQGAALRRGACACWRCRSTPARAPASTCASAGCGRGRVRRDPGAAGGAKGWCSIRWTAALRHWLPAATQTVHLLGASIGAWRMACACLPKLQERWARVPPRCCRTRAPPARLHQPRPPPAAPRRAAAHAAGLPRRPSLANAAAGARWAAGWSAWSSPIRARAAAAAAGRLPHAAGAAGGAQPGAGGAGQLLDPVLARGRARHARRPAGAYWDGGITDYHLHLDYARWPTGLVLYPHFQPHVVPGWLDKPWKRRHRATAALDNVVLLAPHPDWVRKLPGGKLPDRSDFKTYGDDEAGASATGAARWPRAQRLADEFADWVARGPPGAAAA
jgi:hypothetical protein